MRGGVARFKCTVAGLQRWLFLPGEQAVLPAQPFPCTRSGLQPVPPPPDDDTAFCSVHPKTKQLSTRDMMLRDRNMQRLGLQAVEEMPKPGAQG